MLLESQTIPLIKYGLINDHIYFFPKFIEALVSSFINKLK